jgi:hypothetical protein
VLAVELSFSLVDAALLSAAVAFAVFEVWGLERFAARRAALVRTRAARRARTGRPAPGADARSAVAVAAEREPFEALGEMYPLLTARAARVLEERFAYTGPGTTPALPSGETPERWRAIAETLEVPDRGAEEAEAPAATREAEDELDAEPLPGEPDAILAATSHDPPIVRWAAAVALVLAVLLLLLIL